MFLPPSLPTPRALSHWCPKDRLSPDEPACAAYNSAEGKHEPEGGGEGKKEDGGGGHRENLGA